MGMGLGLFACYLLYRRAQEEDRSAAAAVAAASPEPDYTPSTLGLTPVMVGSVQRDILGQLVLIGSMNDTAACAALQSMARQYTGRLTQPEFATAVNSYLENTVTNDPEARRIQNALIVMRSAECAPKLLLTPFRSALSFPDGITTMS